MFISKNQINTILALEQIMVWRHPGDKPLSEPMVVNLPGYFWLSDGCATNQSEAMLENPCSMNFNDFQSRSQKIHTITQPQLSIVTTLLTWRPYVPSSY